MEKWGFILNPAAGEGRAESFYPVVEKYMFRYRPGSTLRRTTHKNHATEITRELLNEGCTHLVIIGGDGTVNEAAREIVGRDIVLGVIPAGTGNDFMQISGFSDSFTENDWELFFKAVSRPIDVGVCNDRYFFNGMGIGFDAEMTAEVTRDRLKTGRISKAKYNYFIVKTLLWYKERAMRFSLNDSETIERSFMTTISIGRRFAGGFFLTPRAVADDGLLDILKIDPLNLAERLSILMKVPSGTHLGHKKVDYYTSGKLAISFEQPVAAHLDGELISAESFQIGLIPGGLNLIIKENGRGYLKENSEPV